LPLALAAPIAWGLWDLVTAHDFLGSIIADEGLPTSSSSGGHGLGRVPGSLARFIGGFVRPPEMVAAVGGVLLLLLRRDWRRLLLPAALIVLNILTFVVVAGRSGPLEQRYLLVAAGVVLVFAGFAIAQCVTAWSGLADPRERRIAQAAGIVLALACIAYAPIDVRRIDDLRDQVSVADSVYGELRGVLEKPQAGCLRGPVQVPNVRLRPFVGYWGEVDEANVGTEPGAHADVEALTPVARELSSRSLPADPDADPGPRPRWRLDVVCTPQ
jgi:hypothetical protein